MSESPGVAPVTIAPAQPNDAARIAAIERASFSDAWSERSFRDLLGREEAVCVVARHGSEISGYAVAYAAAGEAELANIAVAAGERGRGTGGALLSRVMDWARERGARDMWLEVRASNRAARTLYERFLFQEVGLRKRYYTAPVEDAVVMRCDLDSWGARK
jgi:ribosomal-protein-alanine N-acetyltransferase